MYINTLLPSLNLFSVDVKAQQAIYRDRTDETREKIFPGSPEFPQFSFFFFCYSLYDLNPLKVYIIV
jgi:hypothetical protein